MSHSDEQLMSECRDGDQGAFEMLYRRYEKSVFSFIPNTAETAYYGFLDGLRLLRRQQVRAEIMDACEKGVLTEDVLDDLIMRNWPRGEKAVHKDIKMRTFISQEKGRSRPVVYQRSDQTEK